MGIPDLTNMPVYIPKWLGVNELNIGDEWRAVWVDEDELPPDAPILYAYAVVLCEDKGYAVRRAGANNWGSVEGVVNADEPTVAWAKRAAEQQAGAVSPQPTLIGYFECKATSHNPDFPAGTATVRPIFLVVAKRMKDVGRNAGYERRRFPLNEFARVLRDHYPELNHAILKALDRYLVVQAKGGA